jgi:hypothetical protein
VEDWLWPSHYLLFYIDLSRYIKYLIAKAPAKFPHKIYPTIQSLCMKVLKVFSPKNLKHCVQDKLLTTAKLQAVKAQYQNKFYRAFNTIVDQGIPISNK